MDGKITLEEHFSTALNNSLWDSKGEAGRNGPAYAADVERRLIDPRACIAEMDRAGVEMSIMSLTSPGVQGIADPGKALELAREANDYAARCIGEYPGRLSSFAAVPLHDAHVAADELERAVSDLGLKGALINGYSDLGPREKVRYLDDPALRPFWERVSALGVPVYLHPREPLPSQRRAMEGYPELIGSAWGFGSETSTHAVRLMLSGLFDDYPNLAIILGHLGEGLPFLLPRLQHRIDEQRDGSKGSRAIHRPSYYFARNFWFTTSGHFHSRQLRALIEQVGVERVLFSIDYPYEQMDAAARWFDDLEIDATSKHRIARGNANGLFSLNLEELPHSSIVGFAS